MKYAEKIKGFNPKRIFVEHMLVVRFNKSFIHTILSEEEDNNLGALAHKLVTWRKYLVIMIFTRRKERVPVRRALSLQLLLLKLPHLGEILQ
jgi:hypothetical protein